MKTLYLICSVYVVFAKTVFCIKLVRVLSCTLVGLVRIVLCVNDELHEIILYNNQNWCLILLTN